MTSNPVTTPFGKVFAYLFVARDVTDTRRSQEILVNALRREREVVARLKDLDRAKDDFVSTVSHELRTPMSSIIGSAEMLADGILGDLAPEQQRMVEVIARNGDRLLAPGRRPAGPGDLRPRGLARPGGAGRPARRGAGERRAPSTPCCAPRTWSVSYDLPGHRVPVRGEASHLERAVTNLLTNAVKFTPDGGRVLVGLRGRRRGPPRRPQRRRHGLGIPESRPRPVFGKFFRSAEVQERAIQGSGLGLAIVKTIVESHDGRVGVRSATDAGHHLHRHAAARGHPGIRGRVPPEKRRHFAGF